MEGVGGIILQKKLEITEGPAGGFKQHRVTDLMADRVFQEGQQPPGCALGIGVKQLAAAGGNHGQGSAHRVLPPVGQLLFQKSCHSGDVFH